MPYGTETSSSTSYYTASCATTSATTWDFANDGWIFSSQATTGTAGGNNWQPRTWIPEQPSPVYVQPSQEELAEKKREGEAANERARQLLLDNLNDAQRVMFEQAKKILVKGQESGDQYEISLGRARNIRVLDTDGKYKRTLCAHPREDVPNCDTVLAQKLMLESAEREFLRIANVS